MSILKMHKISTFIICILILNVSICKCNEKLFYKKGTGYYSLKGSSSGLIDNSKNYLVGFSVINKLGYFAFENIGIGLKGDTYLSIGNLTKRSSPLYHIGLFSDIFPYRLNLYFTPSFEFANVLYGYQQNEVHNTLKYFYLNIGIGYKIKLYKRLYAVAEVNKLFLLNSLSKSRNPYSLNFGLSYKFN
jgi:hypothetical protein